MRVSKFWVSALAKKIVENLKKKNLIVSVAAEDKLLAEAEQIILDELMIEDKVNDEVREILKKHSVEIEKGRLDYRRLFELTKQKIVKERNLIL